MFSKMTYKRQGALMGFLLGCIFSFFNYLTDFSISHSLPSIVSIIISWPAIPALYGFSDYIVLPIVLIAPALTLALYGHIIGWIIDKIKNKSNPSS